MGSLATPLSPHGDKGHAKVKPQSSEPSRPALPQARGDQRGLRGGTACPSAVPVPGFALARRDCGSSPEHRLFLSFKFRVQRERKEAQKKKKKGVKKFNLSSRESKRGSGAGDTKG